MSEVIEEYIRRNPSLSQDAAFEGFLKIERIRLWVGTDETRRERLRREFTRVWTTMHSDNSPSQQGANAQQAALVRPQASQPAPARPAAPADAPAPPPRLKTGAPRRLNVLCPSCSHLDVWLQGGDIGCRACGRDYDDMLQLIPVKPVGPFAFMFGEGIEGGLKAAGVAVGLLALYLGLRWL